MPQQSKVNSKINVGVQHNLQTQAKAQLRPHIYVSAVYGIKH